MVTFSLYLNRHVFVRESDYVATVLDLHCLSVSLYEMLGINRLFNAVYGLRYLAKKTSSLVQICVLEIRNTLKFMFL